MNRKESIKYAMLSIEMEGFKFTSEEKVVWKKIADGELPISEARMHGEAFDRKVCEWG